jgi:DNA-binding NtrC family response regulator
MSPSNCKTLIVEDDYAARTALLKLIQLAGHIAMAAETLSDAQHLLRWPPECVLLDLMLPDGNGIDLLRQIRASGLNARVAVVTAAGSAMVDAVQQFKPDVVFRKPVDVPQLLDWLRRA